MNKIYTSTSPNGKYSDDGYTYDQSMETNLVLEVSKIKLESRVGRYMILMQSVE